MKQTKLFVFLFVLGLGSGLIMAKNPDKVYEKAKVLSSTGTVEYQKGGKGEWISLTKGQMILKMDKIRLGEESKLKLTFTDGSILVVEEENEFLWKDLMAKMVPVRKKPGFLARLAKDEGAPEQVDAVAGVRGNKLGDVMDGEKERIYWEK